MSFQIQQLYDYKDVDFEYEYNLTFSTENKNNYFNLWYFYSPDDNEDYNQF